MEVLIKKMEPYAVIPTYAHDDDAGLDLTAIRVEKDKYGNIVYHTGLAFGIPKGYVGLLFPRSSNAKTDLRLTNCVGVIDSGYIGEVTMKFRPEAKAFSWVKKLQRFLGFNIDDEPKVYEVWDRIGQLIIMPYPKIELVQTNELSETARGTGSYGSSGR